jgi:ATP-dependent RNA helicase RhlE
MGLADPLVRGILATGYTAPTEIQSQAIPSILDGKDIIGCAQTGTGKTAAFVLPILNRLETVPRKTKMKKIRALVVTPTRELAVQIELAVRGYGRFMNIKTLAVYGGTRIETQIRFLRRGVEVVVATPGRLLDHIQRRTVNLSAVDILVLDEADRMLDMGFIDDIRKIVKELPDQRQTLLFSATMPRAVKKLTESIQRSPKMIQIGRQHNPIETITQHIYSVEKSLKMDLLLHMIEDWRMFSVLVFSRTKHGADKISRKLKRAGVVAVSIHSGRTQNQRQRALDGFRSGKYHVMVATDVAARGNRCRRPRHRRRGDITRHQLRRAHSRRGLRPSDRPDRPSDGHRRRDYIRFKRRGKVPAPDRQVHRTQTHGAEVQGLLIRQVPAAQAQDRQKLRILATQGTVKKQTFLRCQKVISRPPQTIQKLKSSDSDDYWEHPEWIRNIYEIFRL